MKGIMKIVIHQTVEQTLTLLLYLAAMKDIQMNQLNQKLMVFIDTENMNMFYYFVKEKRFKIIPSCLARC